MKHTKKLSIIYALFFTLMCTGIQAQKFDIDEFHIPDRLNLSNSEYERLQNSGKQLREKLVTDLQTQGYDVISPRKSKIMLERVGIDDVKLDYDTEADKVIFGKLTKTINNITVYAYLYDAKSSIRSFDKPIKEVMLNRRVSELNDFEEINTAVSEIIKGLSLNQSNEAEEAIKRAEELRQEELNAEEAKKRAEELKQKELDAEEAKKRAEELKQEKLDAEEAKKRAEELKQKELDAEEAKKRAEELKQKELDAEEAKKRAEELKQKELDAERKRQKAANKSTRVCSKATGTGLIIAGGLMGGAGLYLRSKAKNIYDDEYVPIVGMPGDRDKLEEARQPNRMAHIMGAASILTAGVGAYLWARCSKKQKNSSGIGNLQITPHLEYNTLTNTNHITARVSFNF